MAEMLLYNSTNVISYTICIFPVLQDYCFLCCKCMTELPTKTMIIRLEAADQMYSSISMIIIV